MSFEFYPPVDRLEVLSTYKELNKLEINWLIEDIVKPELPFIKDSLLQCHELISSDQEIKLPLSSYQSEYIKGVVTRKNFHIINLELLFRNVKSLNHGKTTRMRLNNELVIRQLIECDEFILKSLNKIDDILESKDPLKLVDDVHNLLISISTSLNYLKTPNPNHLFPKYRTSPTNYEPSMPETISLEFFVNDNDLFVEFHELQPVTVKPWSIVNQRTGVSFVDELKLKISKQRRKSINTIINESTTDHSIPTGGIASFFHNKKQENLKFVENCITYENNRHQKCVVTVKKNLEINVGDPLLLSIATKLASVENNIINFYSNLINVVDAEEENLR